MALSARSRCLAAHWHRWSAETGEEVFVDVFGFWSRDAVWRRVELVRKGFPARILLAVPKQNRVSVSPTGSR